MKSQLVLGRIMGVEIGVHSSWLVLAALVVSTLAGHFSATAPEWGPKLIWTTAAVTAVLVFASLILHELAHAVVARARGVPVPAITLFALGGVAQMTHDVGDPRTEFWMGLAGPAASGAIAFLAFLGAGALASEARPRPAAELLAWVGAINGALAAFNLIPGFPLDGGRLLRAALWGWSGDFMRATRIASRIGQAVGCGFLFLGLMRAFSGYGLGGLWMALLGWFLLEAATATYVQAEIREMLGGVRTVDIMDHDPARVEGRVPLSAFVDESVLADVGLCYVVCDNGAPVGLITAREISAVPRLQWSDTPISKAMRRLDTVPSIAPETPASDALELMARENALHLPVLSQGRLFGLLSRTQVVKALASRRLPL